MLNSIRLSNFKAARELEIELKPLTILAGMNGSGKSTILQSLAVLRQTYGTGSADGLLLGGDLIQLGVGRDVLSEGAEAPIASDTPTTITIEISDDEGAYRWTCASPRDSNELPFAERPGEVPKFVLAGGFQYLQADRIVPRTLYPSADQRSRNLGFLGTHGEFAADYLSRKGGDAVRGKRCCTQDNTVLPGEVWAQITPTSTLTDQVAGWLQQVSPGAQLSAEKVAGTDEVILQFRYYGGAAGRSNQYRPTHVGFGLTYVMPVLIACLSAPPDSLLLLENPEAHLHPRGQAAMGELLARCAADGVQLIVETHSDHLLNGIRLAVRRQLLAADQSELHFFSRDLETGDCTKESPAILPNGELTNWPRGFFDQWETSLDALLA